MEAGSAREIKSASCTEFPLLFILHSSTLLLSLVVLGSAGLGLIFRRSWLGWPKPANQIGYSIPCDVILSTSVGSCLEEGDLLLRSKLSIRQWESCILYILFISIVVVIFFSFCYSIKLFLSQPTNFAFSFCFSSPSHQGGGRSERETVWFFVASWG